jgi:hypothetical protein
MSAAMSLSFLATSVAAMWADEPALTAVRAANGAHAERDGWRCHR